VIAARDERDVGGGRCHKRRPIIHDRLQVRLADVFGPKVRLVGARIVLALHEVKRVADDQHNRIARYGLGKILP